MVQYVQHVSYSVVGRIDWMNGQSNRRDVQRVYSIVRTETKQDELASSEVEEVTEVQRGKLII